MVIPALREHPAEALGQSEAFVDVQERLSRAARVDRPVLIVGERGTGKELAASRLHFLSARWGNPLVALNCAALAANLIESELFGHEAGAFTGARDRRAGRFEAADGGTLFLDEIGTIPLVAQEKILRVIEYGTFERVGSSASISVDVRIVAATNIDLRQAVREQRFKADLLDRLAFEVLVLPPLRDRHGDILLLARHFATRMALQLGREELVVFSDEAIRALEAHPWPGNIRELKNVVERAVFRADSAVLTVDDVVFDPFTGPCAGLAVPSRAASPDGQGVATTEAGHTLPPELQTGPLDEALQTLEVWRLRAALDACQFNQRRAARHLGLTYDQFRGRYRKYAERLET